MAETDKDSAIAFLRGVMDDGTASMANRIKAAEAIVRASGETPAAASDVHDLDDGELLARARGETGGHPPREGPKAGGLSRDPSHEHGGDPQVPPAIRDTGVPTRDPAWIAPPAGSALEAAARVTCGVGRPGDLPPGRDVPRETPLTAKRKPGRPKKGPDGTQNGPANSIPIAQSAQNGQPLEPWE